MAVPIMPILVTTGQFYDRISHRASLKAHGGQFGAWEAYQRERRIMVGKMMKVAAYDGVPADKRNAEMMVDHG
jgi:hypothetical protein